MRDIEILESEDIGTREIFGDLPGLAVILSEYSRLVVDLNRSSDQRNAKGVVATIDYHGRAVYGEGNIPGARDVERRIRRHYEPYHSRLHAAIDGRDALGLFDCHSLWGIGPKEAPDAGKRRKDIILGNNGAPDGSPRPGFGPVTCEAKRLAAIRSAFEAEGFSVAINDPYPGGFITRSYGQMLSQNGRYALQIEINQTLYLDKNSLVPRAHDLAQVRERVHRAFNIIAEETIPNTSVG